MMIKLIVIFFLLIGPINSIAQVSLDQQLPLEELVGRWDDSRDRYFWRIQSDPREIRFRECPDSSSLVVILFQDIGSGRQINVYCVGTFEYNPTENEYKAILYREGIQNYIMTYRDSGNYQLHIYSMIEEYPYNDNLSYTSP